MQTLVACAISIDDVRDIFGAAPALAERLRGAAATRFARPAPSKRRWFGPLMRRDDEFTVDAATPTTPDMEALLAGSYVSPERLPQSWALLTAWLEELSPAVEHIEWDRSRADDMEFDLARAGLNSDYALRNLAERDLGVALRPLPGQIAGYAKHVQAAETLTALRAIHDAPETARWLPVVDPLMRVLTVAAERGLDVVVVSAP